MNQANTLCMVAIILCVYNIGYILCFETTMLGGWGPLMVLVVAPLIAYSLGRNWED